MIFEHSFPWAGVTNTLWVSGIGLCQAASLWFLCSRSWAEGSLRRASVKRVDVHEDPDFARTLQTLHFLHFGGVLKNSGAFPKPAQHK